jgi:hypothetical protein
MARYTKYDNQSKRSDRRKRDGTGPIRGVILEGRKTSNRKVDASLDDLFGKTKHDKFNENSYKGDH